MWEIGMRGILVSLLAFVAGFQAIWAAASMENPKSQEDLRSNVTDFRDWLMKQLSQFPKTRQGNQTFGPRGNIGPSRNNQCFTAGQYGQAAKSDWAKSRIMDGLSTLGRELAKTAGTAFAIQSANELQQYAFQLKQSDDADFQKIGALFGQEASALRSGDIQAADQAANRVSAIPKPYIPPGYRPTQGESALVSTFNQVIGTVIAGLGGILGTFVVAQILQALGIPSLDSLLGTGRMTGTSIASGKEPGEVMDNAGADVIRTGGGAATRKLETVKVKPRTSQDSTNAGGAPSAQ
jgi:hypothetical protein